MLQQEQRLLEQFVHVERPLVARLGPGKIEQALDDALAALHFLLDDLEIFLARLARRLGDVFVLPVQRLGARQDGGERIVDLVHHTGGELAHRRELLGLGQAVLRHAPLGHIFADGDDVRDVVALETHRNLGDPIEAGVARDLRLGLHLLNLAGLEHAVELALQQIAGLAVEHLEHFPPQRVFARHALRAGLALAIPGADAEGAVDHVQTHRQRIDDAGGKVALGLHLAGAQRHFGGEVLRQLRGGDHGRQDLCDHEHDVVRQTAVARHRDFDFEQPQRLVFVDQRQAHHDARRRFFALRAGPHPVGDRTRGDGGRGLVALGGHRGVAGAVSRPQPETATPQRKAAAQGVDDAGEGLIGPQSRREDRGDLRQDP